MKQPNAFCVSALSLTSLYMIHHNYMIVCDNARFILMIYHYNILLYTNPSNNRIDLLRLLACCPISFEIKYCLDKKKEKKNARGHLQGHIVSQILFVFNQELFFSHCIYHKQIVNYVLAI